MFARGLQMVCHTHSIFEVVTCPSRLSVALILSAINSAVYESGLPDTVRQQAGPHEPVQHHTHVLYTMVETPIRTWRWLATYDDNAYCLCFSHKHITNLIGHSMPCCAAGYEDAFNAFSWDAPPHANHPMQHQFSSSVHYNRNSGTQQDRQQLHPSMQPRQGFNLQPRHRDVGSGDLGSAMSLPHSSGTEGRAGAAGGVSRGPNKRKGGRSRKAAPNDSNAIQRCLEVVEQLLEEEDAEPFAEPVSWC